MNDCPADWPAPAALAAALERFDAENARDPNQELCDGVAQPRELLYAKRLTQWLFKLCPDPSPALRLAARCQHICRWMIPRDSYPKGRAGYLRWRNELKNFHAEKAAKILAEAGLPKEVIQKVRDLNLKAHFPAEAESRVLEDALCLVFLEFQFAELARKTDEQKLISAIQKTWKKMTPSAHQHALSLPLGEKEKQLLEQALHLRPLADAGEQKPTGPSV